MCSVKYIHTCTWPSKQIYKYTQICPHWLFLCDYFSYYFFNVPEWILLRISRIFIFIKYLVVEEQRNSDGVQWSSMNSKLEFVFEIFISNYTSIWKVYQNKDFITHIYFLQNIFVVSIENSDVFDMKNVNSRRTNQLNLELVLTRTCTHHHVLS